MLKVLGVLRHTHLLTLPINHFAKRPSQQVWIIGANMGSSKSKAGWVFTQCFQRLDSVLGNCKLNWGLVTLSLFSTLLIDLVRPSSLLELVLIYF